jgi:DNA end-binding protein Ku
MTERVIWKGLIRLRAFDAPVRLHNTVREEAVQFHLLHRSDHVRLAQRMVCAFEGVAVPREEQVKGFEAEEGKYILVDPAELEEAGPEGSRMIEVHQFSKAGEISPLFFERTYYLEPDGSRGRYAVLLQALKETGMEGICTWTMRRRFYMGALKEHGGILRLQTLRYADEVIGALSSGPEATPLPARELEIGSELIDKLTVPFEPEKYENEHLARLRELIDRKMRGEHIAKLKKRKAKTTESDKLLQALEASLKRVA